MTRTSRRFTHRLIAAAVIAALAFSGGWAFKVVASPSADAAQAKPVLTPDSPYVDSGLPPERFRADRAPTIITVAFVPGSTVDAVCQAYSPTTPPPGYAIAACVIRRPNGARVMIVANPCETQASHQERLQCHEIGHANGWPASHGE